MVSLLAPSATQPRISQVLPTVKCSSCNQPVPLAELGDHICAKPPPVPSLPRFPTPSLAFSVATPLPGRIASPGPPAIRTPPQRFATPPVRPPQSPQPPPRVVTPASNRPRISTASVSSSTSSIHRRPSPLARHSRNDTSTSFQRPPDFQRQATHPLKPSVSTNPWSTDGRICSTSSASAISSTFPNTPGPLNPGMNPLVPISGPSSLARPPPMSLTRPTERVASFVPESEIGIDTKTGGEAGMAGVGRRGFAAAARAAMFVSPMGYPIDRRPDPPRFLDIDTASRSTDTPPLSAGSGYSSHSPVSPGPLSPGPHTDLIPESFSKSPRIPFASGAHVPSGLHCPRLPTPVKSPVDEIARGTGLSPLDRLPFLGKYKDALTGFGTSPDSFFESEGTKAQFPSRSTANHHGIKHSDDQPRLRNLSVSTVASQTYQRNPINSLHHDSDSDSDSECGLAYADSSDSESGNKTTTTHDSIDRQPSSILRSDSASTSRRVHFLSENNGDTSTTLAYALGASSDNRSTLSSESSTGRQRSDSASSVDTRSIYSRTTSIGPMSGPFDRVALEPKMETLVEEVVIGELHEGSEESYSQKVARHFRGDSLDKGIGFATMSTGVQPHRSNTVQVPPHSPENKPPKLPARARTTNDHKLSLLEPPVARKDKARRARVCLQCTKKIEDGRWIKVDTGAVLCEKCWKNMYLPKCRRCCLPIEKQAVSSADGQLKGKYHKECFNCHVCHQPFPDKSFYVYDGKPLCAYHYHEANDSLCAAARCGQPIEGPCAVSHNGDKYHPEHMTCEYSGSVPCNERLSEYWEIEGRMLCEKHAAIAGNGEDDDEGWVQVSNANKRVTRFMNLGVGIGDNDNDKQRSDTP